MLKEKTKSAANERKIKFVIENNNIVLSFVNFVKKLAMRSASEGRHKTYVNVMSCGLTRDEAQQSYGPLVMVSWY